jgi:hypothetical protein
MTEKCVVKPVETRHAVGTLRDPITGGVQALVNPEAYWSPRSVSDVALDIASGQIKYVVGSIDEQAELAVVRARTGSYLRSRADRASANNLNNLPRYQPGTPPRLVNPSGHRSGKPGLERLPRLLRPEPLDLSLLPGPHRRAASISVVALLVAVILIVRPQQWGAWGGVEYIPQLIRYPRLALVLTGLCLAGAAGALAWGVSGGFRLWSLALVPLGLLAATAGARVAGPGADVIRSYALAGTPLPSSVALYLSMFNLVSLLGILFGTIVAVIGLVFAFLPTRRRSGRLRLWPALLVSATSCLLVLAYGVAYLPRGDLARALTIPHETTASLVPMTFHQSMALEILLIAVFPLYTVVVLSYWQVSAKAKFLAEYSAALSKRLSWQGPTVLLLVLVGCAKAAYVVSGYSGNLPEILGGSAPYWDNAEVLPLASILWAAVVLVPVVWLALRPIRRAIAAGESVFKQGLTASLMVALAVSLPFALESVFALLAQVVPGFSGATFASLLYIASIRLSTWIGAAVGALAAVALWRCKPAAAGTFLMAAAILTLNGLHWAVDVAPFVGLAVVDAAITFLFLALAVRAALFNGKVPGCAVAALLSFTALTHLSSLIPGDVQKGTFEFALVAATLYSVIWRAGEMNDIARTNPDQVVRALAFLASITLVSLVGVKGNDRFGREYNAAVNLWLNTSDGALLVVAPFLVLMLVLAASSTVQIPEKIRGRANV